MSKIIIFHGGCHECTRQLTEPEGVDFCIKCQFFEANWSLPDLNNRPPTQAEIVRQQIKEKYSTKRSFITFRRKFNLK